MEINESELEVLLPSLYLFIFKFRDNVYYTTHNTVEEFGSAVAQAIEEMPRQMVNKARMSLIH